MWLGGLGVLAQSTLYRAMQALQGGEAVLEVENAWGRCYDGARFNDASLVLLPKKVSGSLNGFEFQDPGDTRSLSMANIDNRILANAVRRVIEPMLARSIFPFPKRIPPWPLHDTKCHRH